MADHKDLDKKSTRGKESLQLDRENDVKTIALVIGISDYLDASFRHLPGAQTDAQRFAAALESWRIPKEWIIQIPSQKATKAEIIRAFFDFRSEFDVEAKFIFYFAGHGIRKQDSNGPTSESSLILRDTLETDVVGTGLRLVELMQLIRALKPVQTFLFIDACQLRLNSLINPFNDHDIFSTTNSKGLFCMFSSGVHASYEDAQGKGGFFTSALLKAIGELRHTSQPTCHDILKKVENSLLLQELPTPEAYHVGSSLIFPLENNYTVQKQRQQQSPTLIERTDALTTLEDYLRSSKTPVIWMWGEAGLGKSVIAEQFARKLPQAIYVSVTHSPNLALVIQSLIEQIRSKKSELFFNRAPESLLSLTLEHIFHVQPNTLLILDHIDRLDTAGTKEVLCELDKIPLPCLLISRQNAPKKLFASRLKELFEWRASTFSSEETERLIESCGLENRLSQILINMTNGNALKTRQMLMKLSGQATPLEGKMNQESIRCVSAIIACGGFLDEQLFCQSFHLKPATIATLVQYGLLRYSKEGCFPHDLLEDLIEENQANLDFYAACSYWSLQITHTPFNRLACRSLTLLAGHVQDCRPFRRSLGQCLETLNEREYSTFILDLAAIFKQYEWDDLLLQASDYLIDHEEYQRSGEILDHLQNSLQESQRHHAIKNAIRRLVWIAEYHKAIDLYATVSQECRCKELQVAMRNHVGIAYFFLGSINIALELFRQNSQQEQIQDEREIGITKYMLGLIMTYRNEDIVSAKALIESSILIFESMRFYHWLIVGLNGLADLAYSQKEWKQALVYLQKAHETAKALQNKTFLIFTLKNIARAELRLFGPFSPELNATIKAMEQLLNEVLQVGHNWATMWAQNVLCTVYAHRNEPEKIRPMIHDVAKMTETYHECHIFTLSNLGHLAALNGEEILAKEHYRSAFTLCQKVHNPFARVEIRDDFLNMKHADDLQEELWR